MKQKGGQNTFPWYQCLYENSNFVTNVYSKETFTKDYTNFPSLIPLDYRFGLVRTLFHCFLLVSDMSNFHSETETLKEIFSVNKYAFSSL